MSNAVSERGCFLIEVRREHTYNSPGQESFRTVDEIGGSLDDAKRTAQAYHNRHVASNRNQLGWVVGFNGGKPCLYAPGPSLTFRITNG